MTGSEKRRGPALPGLRYQTPALRSMPARVCARTLLRLAACTHRISVEKVEHVAHLRRGDVSQFDFHHGKHPTDRLPSALPYVRGVHPRLAEHRSRIWLRPLRGRDSVVDTP